jgi:acyl-CoA thioesterase II
MSESAKILLSVLDLEVIEMNLFRGRNERGRGGRLFGGQVLAQALRAAANTVEGRLPHSLHGYFLRPGDPTLPVLYEVERIRDGTSFTTRRVVAIQHGNAIFNMDTSFQIDEPGFSHEDPMPNVPYPEELEDDTVTTQRLGDSHRRFGGMGGRERPFQTRSVYALGAPRSERERFWNPVWVRFRAGLPVSDPAMAYCLLAYASDMGLVGTAAVPHVNDRPRSGLQTASLDHALWFHRPFDIEDWILFVRRTTSANGSRGMNHAEFFDRDGRLVASGSQEGLMRIVERKGAPRVAHESG